MTNEPPLFRQIADKLKLQIEAGNLPAHEALPSERLVAVEEGVSRMTARRALETLEAEGLAYSKGRSGRFISPPRVEYDLATMTDFVADAARRGLDINVSLLSSRQTIANADVADRLSIDNAALIFENHRLFRHQNHALFIETEYVVIDRCDAQIAKWSSLSAEARQNLRYSPLGTTADIVISMRPFTQPQATQLDVAPNQMGIVQQQIVRDRTDAPLCLAEQIWRGELAQFTVRAHLG